MFKKELLPTCNEFYKQLQWWCDMNIEEVFF